MLINFFLNLRNAKVPVSIREYMDLISGLDHDLVYADMDQFYYLSRACLVKDEKHYDKFDRAFAQYFDGIKSKGGLFTTDIPEEWLRKQLELNLSDEEKAAIEAMGGLEKLMEEFQKKLQEQEKRHQGGNKMIGTAGRSPFGGHGYNPEGFRVTGDAKHKKAIKVWERRQYRNLDDSVQLGTRNIKMALRRLRRFARDGAEEELDLDDTIRSTADRGGMLDIKMVPERKNRVKVLLFFDIGGSMDPHIKVCEEMFSAARTEFKHLEYFYFHNFIYEGVWRDNIRRWHDRVPVWDIIRTYGRDYRVIFVGDATMSPFEINSVGGSVEHYNDEPGIVWMDRLTDHFEKFAWLNPEREGTWRNSSSTVLIKDLVHQHMYPLTIKGIEGAMRYLSR